MPVATSYAAVQRRVVERQRSRFGDTVRSFARGTKFKPGGRAPHLHILRWLSEAESWSISIIEEMRKHPTEKSSVGVVLDPGCLANLAQQEQIAKLVHSRWFVMQADPAEPERAPVVVVLSGHTSHKAAMTALGRASGRRASGAGEGAVLQVRAAEQLSSRLVWDSQVGRGVVQPGPPP